MFYRILFITIVFLTGCNLHNNSVDPDSDSFIGYNTVGLIEEIQPVLINDYIGRSVLVSSRYYKDITYEYQVKESGNQDWDSTPVLTSNSNIFNVSDLNLSDGISYSWRVRGIGIDFIRGRWSTPQTIETSNNVLTTYPKITDSLYYSNFLYIVIESLSWGDSWEIRYKTDSGYISIKPESDFSFIGNVSGIDQVVYQVRELKGDISGFWSREVKLIRTTEVMEVNNILSQDIQFVIGAVSDDADTPDKTITIKSGLSMGKYEISTALFCSIVNSQLLNENFQIKLTKDDLYNNDELVLKLLNIKNENGTITPVEGYKKHPVVGVTWYGALFFSELLNDLEGWDEITNLETEVINYSGAGYRLPLESEWEYAACSGINNIYPWGNYFDTESLNSNSEGTAACGLFSGSVQFNCYDLAGNVWEWCLDNYSTNGYFTMINSDNKIIRGGSWSEESESFFNNSLRSYKKRYDTASNIGFRLIFQYGRLNEK